MVVDAARLASLVHGLANGDLPARATVDRTMTSAAVDYYIGVTMPTDRFKSVRGGRDYDW